MSLPPIVTVASLEIRLGVAVGSLAGLNLARAEAAIADASDLVREIGLPWVAVDGVTITAPAAVAKVVRTAALRDYNNPDNMQGEAFGSDYSYQRAPGTVSAYLTKDETKIVRRAANASGRAFSIHTYIPEVVP